MFELIPILVILVGAIIPIASLIMVYFLDKREKEASQMHDDALSIKKWERNISILKAQIFRMKMTLSN